MVSKVVENGIESGKIHSLPPGDYHLIGWDVDTTGRRLVDEICQIAAYTPTANFSQYVMPFQEVNPAARRRHNIRIVTIGRFRMLKDSKTNKVLKTKSEISALTDFVQWLEAIKGKTSDGVILVSHESRKVAAPLLLEALRKYNMLDKFTSIVKGFANGYTVAEVKCAKTVRSFTLRTLSRVLLDKDEELDSAVDRARLAFQVVQHLCGGEERQGSGDGGETVAPGLVQAINEFTQTLAEEEAELARVKTILERQNSLRPVFALMLRREKHRAVHMRRLVAESGIDYEMLTSTYNTKGVEGISELINTKLQRSKPKDMEDLKSLLHEHFEGDKGIENKASPQRNKAAPNSPTPQESSAHTSEDAVTSPASSASNSPIQSPNPPASASPTADLPAEKPSVKEASEPTSPDTTTGTSLPPAPTSTETSNSPSPPDKTENCTASTEATAVTTTTSPVPTTPPPAATSTDPTSAAASEAVTS